MSKGRKKGFKCSLETRLKMKKAAIGRRLGCKASEETKAKMRASALKAHKEGRHGSFKKGHKSYLTPESLIKMSKSKKGILIAERITKYCKSCGKEIVVTPSQSRRKYCSDECKLKDSSFYKKGSEHSSFTGGVHITPQGYVLVLKSMLGYQIKNSRQHNVLFHRFLAEVILGRKLRHEEVIHHIDENKQNNRPENLYYYPSAGPHLKAHRSGNLPVESNLLGQKLIEDFQRFLIKTA